ncbi:MAG: tRNA (adenosine(37)-N6)-threonylcarbamoyltransferase complex transferase subunit TsaD, partial [bacterium]|nr:tRNA (adenosine(37)-N6)-threonylcarbamoyltransferase complex transferase subunit TsaD [bacterium]
GLKTAVLYDFKSRTEKVRKSEEYIVEMCREVQQAVIDVLIKKTIKAAKDYRAKLFILGGGVAANEELRKQFQERIAKEMPNMQYKMPDIKYCTDNAAMVAVAAYFHFLKKENHLLKDIIADSNLRI